MRLLKKAKDEGLLPKYILVENVKNLVCERFREQFDDLCLLFDELGFNVYWDILNAKNCVVPQNRERVFMVCIRKDIDTGLFTFPVAFDLGIRLRDMLEIFVPEKYYIRTDKAKTLINDLVRQGNSH